MQASLQFRVSIALGVLLGAATITSGYSLYKFHAFDSEVSRMMSGDQKTLIAGQVLESKIRAAGALVEGSVSSTEGNEAFKAKVQNIAEEYKALMGKESKTLTTDEMKGAPEDLFIHYRNIKTAAFNIYRNAWNNKWMNVAHISGLIVNDLDNLPYHDGEKVVAGINAKVTQLSTFVTGTALPHATKLSILQQLGALKAQATKYSEFWDKSQKVKAARIEALKKLDAEMKSWNEAQGKAIIKFVNGGSHDFLKAFLSFVFFLAGAGFWAFLTMRKFSKHVTEHFSDLTKQISAWITPAGNSTLTGITKPRQIDVEFVETYDLLDGIVKRMNQVRKEDVVVKRLLNVPFVLINRAQKKAVYWNSALSILGKIRALEESGAVAYNTILRFTDAAGKPIDPIDRCFIENKEITQLTLFRAGSDSIASQITCTPVNGADDETEYVMVQVRDIRDENRRLEAELDRQLEVVRAGAEAMARGRIPEVNFQNWTRKPVIEVVSSLKSHVISTQEKQKIIAAQLSTFWQRFEKESTLKDAIQRQIELLTNETAGVRAELGQIRAKAQEISTQFVRVEQGEGLIIGDYREIRSKGEKFADDLKRTRDTLSTCMKEILKAEELAKSVRVHEKTIQSLMQRTSLMHINNSIIENNGSGKVKELSPEHLIMITENLNQILIQFQRTYRLIETSVREIEGGFKLMGSRIRDQIKSSIELIGDDQKVVAQVRECGRAVETNQELIRESIAAIDEFLRSADNADTRTNELFDKATRMIEISKSSLAVHAELGRGLKKVTDDLASNFESKPQGIAAKS